MDNTLAAGHAFPELREILDGFYDPERAYDADLPEWAMEVVEYFRLLRATQDYAADHPGVESYLRRMSDLNFQRFVYQKMRESQKPPLPRPDP